jgi:hypothetical protein
VAEGDRPVYSGSAMARERWTDDRLDDLVEATRIGFERIDREFDRVHTDIRELRQTMLRGWITMLATQMVGFLGVIATILARGA